MYEEFNEEYFLNQAKALGDELGVDTRTGSVYADLSAGHAIRTAFFMANMSEISNMFAIDTCYADVLDDKAAEAGLERHQATSAVYNAEFVGTTPAAGDRFFAVDTEYYFIAIEDGDEIFLQAELAGTEVNTLSAGAEIVPVDDIEGLEEAYLGEIRTLGTDEESDDALRTRLREKVSGPAENNNRQQYKTWCESIDGVGRARIIPLFAGENTVRAILYASDGKPCSAEVVAAVQEYIDPITQNYEFEDPDGNKYIVGDGWGDGVSSMGAHFLASPADAMDISVSFNVTPAAGGTIDSIKEAVTEVLESYMTDLALNTSESEAIVVRYSRVAALIADLDEVLDYSELTVNGDVVNITLGADDVPVLKEVIVGAET